MLYGDAGVLKVGLRFGIVALRHRHEKRIQDAELRDAGGRVLSHQRRAAGGGTKNDVGGSYLSGSPLALAARPESTWVRVRLEPG